MSDALERDVRSFGSLPPAAKLGAELRAARENLGWELPDLAASLRIRRAYLEAIEGGRLAELPGTIYAVGFVRAYASAMGLNGEAIASRFRAETAEANVRPALSFPAPVPQRGVPAGALMLLGLVIIAGAYAGYYYFSERFHTPVEIVPPIPDHLQHVLAKQAPSPQIASILPAAAPPAPLPATHAPSAAVAPSATVPTQVAVTPAPVVPPPVIQAAPSVAAASVPPGTHIVLKATADVWVTVKPKGGTPIFSRLLHAGDSWPVPADRTDLLLTTGNAGGTVIDVDGAPVPGLGAPGAVRRDLPLDAAILKSGVLPGRTIVPAVKPQLPAVSGRATPPG